jgi:hypothetical protein
VSFRKLNGAVMTSDMKPQRGRSIDGPSLRGLWGRSATGQNGQAAANKEVSAVWSEGWMSENISGVPAGRSVFHLTSPFIGLTENCLIRGRRRPFDPRVFARRKDWFPLLQLGVLRFGFLQDGDVGVGVFPEGKEILISSFRFGGVAGEGVGTGQSNMR